LNLSYWPELVFSITSVLLLLPIHMRKPLVLVYPPSGLLNMRCFV
jgi:hypothetical protein